MIIDKNSEILFLLEAKMCNPNGDPDNENKPRMDWANSRNLVSDVRLKRYIRDYLKTKGEEIYVTDVDGETLNASDRLRKLVEKYVENVKQKNVELTEELKNLFLEKLIDVRLFGATMPIKGGFWKGTYNLNYTGPIQFTWGYSLNKVELLDSPSITSRFSSESDKKQGAIGKDWRIKYSLIAFYGAISSWNAQKVKLTYEDLKKFDEAIVSSIYEMTVTRSKIGQRPILYLRVEWKNNERIKGDLRNLLELNEKDYTITDFSDIKVVFDESMEDNTLSFKKLLTFLDENKDKIEKIVIFTCKELEQLKEKIKNLGLNMEIVTK